MQSDGVAATTRWSAAPNPEQPAHQFGLVYLEQDKGNAPKTIKNKHGFLSAPMRAAVEQRPTPLLAFNPCAGIRLPRDDDTEIEIFDNDEWELFEQLLGRRGPLGAAGLLLSRIPAGGRRTGRAHGRVPSHSHRHLPLAHRPGRPHRGIDGGLRRYRRRAGAFRTVRRCRPCGLRRPPDRDVVPYPARLPSSRRRVVQVVVSAAADSAIMTAAVADVALPVSPRRCSPLSSASIRI